MAVFHICKWIYQSSLCWQSLFKTSPFKWQAIVVIHLFSFSLLSSNSHLENDSLVFYCYLSHGLEFKMASLKDRRSSLSPVSFSFLSSNCHIFLGKMVQWFPVTFSTVQNLKQSFFLYDIGDHDSPHNPFLYLRIAIYSLEIQFSVLPLTFRRF